MALDLFAGLFVTDRSASVDWYTRLFGAEPVMYPNDTEAVWELGEHQFVYIEALPGRAGRGQVTIVLSDVDDADDADDLDARVEGATSRGIEPSKRETYDSGVRKITYTDPDGNEVGLGGAPLEDA